MMREREKLTGSGARRRMEQRQLWLPQSRLCLLKLLHYSFFKNRSLMGFCLEVQVEIFGWEEKDPCFWEIKSRVSRGKRTMRKRERIRVGGGMMRGEGERRM
ncbi:hypothetical protein V6Z11_D11G228100 [Gossypium hirsutum]